MPWSHRYGGRHITAAIMLTTWLCCLFKDLLSSLSVPSEFRMRFNSSSTANSRSCPAVRKKVFPLRRTSIPWHLQAPENSSCNCQWQDVRLEESFLALQGLTTFLRSTTGEDSLYQGPQTRGLKPGASNQGPQTQIAPRVEWGLIIRATNFLT